MCRMETVAGDAHDGNGPSRRRAPVAEWRGYEGSLAAVGTHCSEDYVWARANRLLG